MKRAEHQPTTALALYGGIYCKTYTVADAGTLLPQHSHEWDHLTLIVHGAVRVWRGERMDGDYEAPQMIKIPARQFHKFLTLCDGVVLACIHAVGADGEPAIHADHVVEMED